MLCDQKISYIYISYMSSSASKHRGQRSEGKPQKPALTWPPLVWVLFMLLVKLRTSSHSLTDHFKHLLHLAPNMWPRISWLSRSVCSTRSDRLKPRRYDPEPSAEEKPEPDLWNHRHDVFRNKDRKKQEIKRHGHMMLDRPITFKVSDLVMKKFLRWSKKVTEKQTDKFSKKLQDPVLQKSGLGLSDPLQLIQKLAVKLTKMNWSWDF